MMTSMQNHPLQHQRALPLPRSKPRQHQCGSLQSIENNKSYLNVSTTRNRSQPPKQQRKPRLQQKLPGSSNTSFPPLKIQYQIQCSPPNANDVVCFQPNSTHEGNLFFGVVARNFANYYKRVTTVVTANSSASLRSTTKKIQKQIVWSIVAEVQSNGGRFVVWIKRKGWGNSEDSDNGYWTLVKPEDVFRSSRWALLKEVEALEREAELEHKIEIEIKPPPGFSMTPSSEHYESSSSDNDCIDRRENESNSCTILNMLSGMSVDSDDDSLDAWSTSSSTDDNCTEHAAVRLDDAKCWDYKLLLPQTMQ